MTSLNPPSFLITFIACIQTLVPYEQLGRFIFTDNSSGKEPELSNLEPFIALMQEQIVLPELGPLILRELIPAPDRVINESLAQAKQSFFAKNEKKAVETSKEHLEIANSQSSPTG
ncbi:hypothetical protein BN59_03629 [Legionella massiliensis]|uniref:Uncharacterized protein n=2 Tax=Legionella massiliensis TaxID=1034943 RepID=A0A078L289_9GAMM|nr:hypothetical protein BN59_03629 [Legionella massiliensis]CEE15049.1 hypothetical protein BN1094_03629 [Legionella massiliensis]